MTSFWQKFFGFTAIALLATTGYAEVRHCKIISSDSGPSQLRPDYPPVFWEPQGVIQKVKDGLALTIDRSLVLVDPNGSDPNKVLYRCRLMYDLWKETFILEDRQMASQQRLESAPYRSRFAATQWKNALERCGDVPIPPKPTNLIHIEAVINPVDHDQELRTREWLASKGIGGGKNGFVSRALGAVINLRADSVIDYDCTP